jgi:predicted PurR-regulated permease PerM
VSVVQAGIVLVATLALRVPNAVVWGVASFALSFVPLIGTAAVTLSAAAWLLLMGRTGAAVVMVVVAIIAGSVDNILRPMLARGASELSFLWMMVAFVGGVTVFGVPGVILGPLALAWATALWEALHLSDEPDLSDD